MLLAVIDKKNYCNDRNNMMKWKFTDFSSFSSGEESSPPQYQSP